MSFEQVIWMECKSSHWHERFFISTFVLLFLIDIVFNVWQNNKPKYPLQQYRYILREYRMLNDRLFIHSSCHLLLNWSLGFLLNRNSTFKENVRIFLTESQKCQETCFKHIIKKYWISPRRANKFCWILQQRSNSIDL